MRFSAARRFTRRLAALAALALLLVTPLAAAAAPASTCRCGMAARACCCCHKGGSNKTRGGRGASCRSTSCKLGRAGAPPAGLPSREPRAAEPARLPTPFTLAPPRATGRWTLSPVHPARFHHREPPTPPPRPSHGP